MTERTSWQGLSGSSDGPRVGRQSADLPPASRPCRRDDTRRSSQGRRSVALRAQRPGRISAQSAHGSEGLSATGGRGLVGTRAEETSKSRLYLMRLVYSISTLTGRERL